MRLPQTRLLRLASEGDVLTAWLDDAATRNALTAQMRDDLNALVATLEHGSEFRVLVLRGASGTFCSGGDLKAFKRLSATSLAADGTDPIAADNAIYGDFLRRYNLLPLTTIALVEGSAFAGALGLLCVTDAVIVLETARFSMSETTLGLVPAQIAPFLVQRIGLTHTRRLALTGARFDGIEAQRLGIAHFVQPSIESAEALLAELIGNVLRCAPRANAATKQLLLDSAPHQDSALLDRAAQLFAQSLRGEGSEGTNAFAEKRRPSWVQGR